MDTEINSKLDGRCWWEASLMERQLCNFKNLEWGIGPFTMLSLAFAFRLLSILFNWWHVSIKSTFNKCSPLTYHLYHNCIYELHKNDPIIVINVRIYVQRVLYMDLQACPFEPNLNTKKNRWVQFPSPTFGRQKLLCSCTRIQSIDSYSLTLCSNFGPDGDSVPQPELFSALQPFCSETTTARVKLEHESIVSWMALLCAVQNNMQ